MKNTLLGRGILLPTGEISKDKINLVAGAVTQPFAEMVWATTGGDWKTINRLTEILVTMNTAEDGGKLFKIVQMLYGLLGLRFPEEAAAMGLHPEAAQYFLFSFAADFGKIMQEYKREEKRTEFKRMIAACKRGRIDLILTKSLSRFARNTVDSLEMVRMLRANGIGVIFEKENINGLFQLAITLWNPCGLIYYLRFWNFLRLHTFGNFD